MEDTGPTLLEAVPDGENVANWQFRIWQAALYWIAAVGRQVARTYPKSFPKGVFQTTVTVPIYDGYMRMDISSFDDTPPVDAVLDQDEAGIRITQKWVQHLWNPENDAEIELTAAILENIAASQRAPKV